MFEVTHKPTLFGGLKTRWYLSQAARAAGAAGANEFVAQPQPRPMGNAARGRQLVAGNVLCTGHLLDLNGDGLWSVSFPSDAFGDEMHGFTWLDDLAALGTDKAHTTANRWVQDWIDMYGRGRGPGWRADVIGRRLIRWVNHGLLLLAAADKNQSDRYFASLSQQTIFLARVWGQSPLGVGRFESLAGVIYAGLAPCDRELRVRCKF